MLKKIMGIGLCVLSGVANAKDITIKQMDPAKHMLVVENTEGLIKVGDEFLPTVNGQQCALKTLSLQGTVAVLSSEGCSFENQLKLGQKLEKSLLTSEPEAPKPTQSVPPLPVVVSPPKVIESATVRKTHFSLYGYYSAADSLEFDDVSVKASGASAVGTVKFKTEGVVGFGFEGWDAERYNWGWAAGLNYDPSRDIKSWVSTEDGVAYSGVYASPRPKLSVISLHANAIYRWDQFYLPFGVNFSKPTFTAGAGSTASISTKGAIGVQLGVGVHVSENMRIELISRSIQASMTGVSSTVNVDYGMGDLTGLNLVAKWDVE